ncbi:MAG: hypothetical protein WDN09_04050 [bacterium]
MKGVPGRIFKILVYAFAIVGAVFTAVFVGMQFGAFNVRGSNAVRNASLGIPEAAPIQDCADTAQTTCDWDKTVEWDILKTAFTKDASVINKVAEETGVSPRLLVAVVSPEQIRFFTSNRESFKRVFEPLKILISLSKFSLGVSGIKEDTAKDIETYANDPTSPFYPGSGMAELIAYPEGADHDTELFNRLTDEHDHYYSYLYTALYIKEIESQWAKAGYDVSAKPEVVVTLFNIGFQASRPNPTPVVAGAAITLAEHTYSYGELGTLIYNSDELSTVFPK